MNLQEIIKKKQDAGEVAKAAEQEIPQFDINGCPVITRQPKECKKTKISIVIVCFLVVVFSFLYIPGLFLGETVQSKVLVKPNADVITLSASYLEKMGDSDFDYDGVKNKDEIQKGSNPYSADTDGDGLEDGLDEEPTVKGNDVEKALMENKIIPKSAYEMNGVILWADDQESCTYGSVMRTFNGYYFKNFKGWANGDVMCDYIAIYDQNDMLIGQYYGKQLSSQTVTVPGDTVKLRLVSDDAWQYYGFAITSITAVYGEQPTLLGDVNGDSDITGADVVLLRRAVAELATLDEAAKLAADVNGDGDITGGDVVLLRRFVAELVDSLG